MYPQISQSNQTRQLRNCAGLLLLICQTRKIRVHLLQFKVYNRHENIF